MMKRSHLAATASDATHTTEEAAHIRCYRTQRRVRIRGLFQQRWCDFHVRELSSEGLPVRLLPHAPPETYPCAPDASYVHFLLAKENRTTSDALRLLASAASASLGALGVAGSKDRRAVTVQRVSARGVACERLLRVNRIAAGRHSTGRVRVGGFTRAAAPLSLREARGNAFTVVLRELALLAPRGDEAAPQGDEALATHCEAAVDALRARGFVNYFGLQRFGSNPHVPTHAVGARLLRADFFGALCLLLHPASPGLKGAAQDALAAFAESPEPVRAARAALRVLRKGTEQRLLHDFAKAAQGAVSTGEGGAKVISEADRDAAALYALQRLPRRTLMLYLNAFQSAAWNRAASCRLVMASDDLMVGDLVLLSAEQNGGGPHASSCDGADSGEGPPRASPPDDLCDGADGGDDDASSIGDLSPNAGDTTWRTRLPGRVRALTKEDLASGMYSMSDIVLPLPGHSVMYPSNETARAYAASLEEYGMSGALSPGHATSSHSSSPPEPAWFRSGGWDLPGAYRALLAFPKRLEARLQPYTDHRVALEPSDIDVFDAKQHRLLDAVQSSASTSGAAAHLGTAAEHAAAVDVGFGSRSRNTEESKATEPVEEPHEILDSIPAFDSRGCRVAWIIKFELQASASMEATAKSAPEVSSRKCGDDREKTGS
ncbi:hypothetical protein AB1Y20_016838 [Prymnesium parvum]|uniref:TRUD domain-containing protein n=1 Tax=Prymnesium parvum TaxID=97485 RepID=A0AB34IA48_PRYPA